MRPLAPSLRRRYLDRLGIDDPGQPSALSLWRLHRAHVERVPYETIDITLGRPTTVLPRDSVDRILRGRGGYCVQLNGAFAALLAALGYDVTWHRAGVQIGASPPATADHAPHLGLTVTLEGRRWLTDVGLGDGLYEPLPLRAGLYRQGPFRYRLRPSAVEPGGWRFDSDRRALVTGLDVRPSPAGVADFARWHPFVSTSPQSRLVRVVTVLRRDADGFDRLSGCMLSRVDAAGRSQRELDTQGDWFAALDGVFGLTLAELDDRERDRLWRSVRAAHESWRAARAS
jgi:arylamine N-acetyltransferase